MPDYAAKARALRRKADDKATTPEEAKILRAKADELDAKYGSKPGAFSFTVNVPSGTVYDTTVTSRSGQWNPFQRPAGYQTQDYNSEFWRNYYEGYNRERDRRNEEERKRRYEEAVRQTENLWRSQAAWNPPPDDEDTSEFDFNYEREDEDYGYDY